MELMNEDIKRRYGSISKKVPPTQAEGVSNNLFKTLSK
jgi:hypothetical protein